MKETRYFLHYGHDGIRPSPIEGTRGAKEVRVNRSCRELVYRIRVPISWWEKLATDPKGAFVVGLQAANDDIETAQNALQSRVRAKQELEEWANKYCEQN